MILTRESKVQSCCDMLSYTASNVQNICDITFRYVHNDTGPKIEPCGADM